MAVIANRTLSSASSASAAAVGGVRDALLARGYFFATNSSAAEFMQ